MDPELTKVINGNLPPTDLQSRDIRRILASKNVELVQLDATISAISLILSELEFRKSRHQETVVALQGTLSPIRRIPPEIFTEIFLLCRNHSMSSAVTYSIADPREAPLVLGHVSSRWRAICHGTPSLWDDIWLMSGSRMPGLPYIQNLLARSQNLPVSARLATWGDAVLTPDTVFALFLGLHSRLKTISLDIPASHLLPPRKHCQDEVFPLLTSIEVTFTDDFSSDVASALRTFSHAPSLERVSLITHCAPRHARSLVDALPWSQLTQLTLHLPISLHDVRLILTLCRRLQTAQISECTGPPDIVEHAVELPVLRTLDFYAEGDEDDAAIAFFAAFAFPGLQNLDIRAEAFAPHILPSLLDRSQFRLETLELHGFPIPSDDLLALLCRLPTLRELSLCYCGIDDEVFAHFTLDTLSTPLAFPHLEHLCLSEYVGTFEGTSAADMAESLCLYSGISSSALPALRSVTLSLHGEKFDSEVERRLAAACSTGLIVDDGVRVRT